MVKVQVDASMRDYLQAHMLTVQQKLNILEQKQEQTFQIQAKNEKDLHDRTALAFKEIQSLSSLNQGAERLIQNLRAEFELKLGQAEAERQRTEALLQTKFFQLENTVTAFKALPNLGHNNEPSLLSHTFTRAQPTYQTPSLSNNAGSPIRFTQEETKLESWERPRCSILKQIREYSNSVFDEQQFPRSKRGKVFKEGSPERRQHDQMLLRSSGSQSLREGPNYEDSVMIEKFVSKKSMPAEAITDMQISRDERQSKTYTQKYHDN